MKNFRRYPLHALPSGLGAILSGVAVLSLAAVADAHSVAQVQTAKRIAQSTIVLLDPQGNPEGGGAGTDTTASVGDVLSYVIQFTPVPNNATRGAGGYITEYVPPNTEVVGARLIDALGNTVRPKRGPQMDDGWGPRGREGDFDGLGLEQGSLAQVYADTGIFFSTDARTARTPADTFITVFNGLPVTPVPTGAGQLDQFLGFTGPPFHAHAEWDRVQAIAFGANGGSVGNGTGNTPFGFGSAVAGPQTHYPYEKVLAPRCSNGVDDDADGVDDYPDDAECASGLDDDETAAADAPVGPWQRIRYAGSEIGAGGATSCQSCAGGYVRVGVPTDLGWDLSADNPLPPGTNAVRFAVGELIVGQEYFAEISVRVLDLPLDPGMDADVNCSEVFGGDAAMPQNGQDNTWRYFVPAPACVQLNLVFDLDVDTLLAVNGDTLVYTLHGKNLSVNPQTNVQVTDTFVGGDVGFVGAVQGPAPVVGNGTITWPVMDLDPGEEYTFQWEMEVTGNGLSTLNRATYVSDALPTPGFSVVALTNIQDLVVIDLDAVASTTPATTPPSTSAGSNVHYTATVANSGTGAATLNGASFVEVTLPAGFSFCAGGGCAAPQVNGVNVAAPAVGPGNTLVFTTGLAAVPAGGAMVVDFDATVGAGVAPGLYTIDLQTQLRDDGVGRDTENAAFGLAPLLVDIARSEPPVLDEPVLAGATSVTGTTSEGPGAAVTVIVNGNPVAPVVAGAGGQFTAVVPTLFGGQHLNAIAQAAGEVASEPSDPDVIVLGTGGTTACNDGVDNDGDALVDFPADPGCESAVDPDETDVPQCSDGVDNDGDGAIDFPDDASCASFLDGDESGLPACSNGVDDDDDGALDFPDDAGCTSADDASEADVPACANGVDDDDDGLVDYPTDPGCVSATDDDELEGSTGTEGGGGQSGSPVGPGAGGASPASNGAGNGTPPDLGGVPVGPAGSGGAGDGLGSGAGDDGGCGCRTAPAPAPGGWWFALAAAALATLRRSRRARASGLAGRHR